MLRIRRYALVWTAWIVVTFLALPATAETYERSWQIRLDGLWIDPDFGAERIDANGDRLVLESSDQLGAGLTLAYRFSRRLSFEVGTAFVEPDITVRFELDSGARVEAIDSLRFLPITAGLNLHLTPDRKVDVYLGALVSYVSYSDLALDFVGTGLSATLEADDDFGWGVTFGVARPLAQGPWSLHFGAQYLNTAVDLFDPIEGEGESLDFDPLIARFGIGYRF